MPYLDHIIRTQPALILIAQFNLQRDMTDAEFLSQFLGNVISKRSDIQPVAAKIGSP